MRSVVLPVCFSLALGAQVFAQSPYTGVSGTVEKVDAKGGEITVKPDKGADTTKVMFDERTTISVIPPGETDVKKATPGSSSDVAPGDKVLARVLTADPTGKPARTIYVMKQAELEAAGAELQEEWKTATNGLISSGSSPGEIKINSRVGGSPTPKEITLEISPKTDYERYNPENGKYEASTLAAIKTGDQLRVLGEKNADGTHIKAENIGTGSIPDHRRPGEIDRSGDKANYRHGDRFKKPIVVALRSDTELKKFTDMAAMMVARQLNPTYQQAGGGRAGSAVTAGARQPAEVLQAVELLAVKAHRAAWLGVAAVSVGAAVVAEGWMLDGLLSSSPRFNSPT